MDSGPDTVDVEWLAACRRASGRIEAMLAGVPSQRERVRETGTIGGGGDRTLVIDQTAEDLVVEELVAAGGPGFRLVSEERGEVDYGGAASGGGVVVVVDPIDGSLNAKRGIGHHALSVAVAGGPTMADVEFGYVYDFGAEEEWWAQRGGGAFLDGARLDPEAAERSHDGRVEVLGIEAADPRWVAAAIDGLVASAYRLRAIGAIAVSLCHVAAARFDGMVSLRKCRAVDAAAGQLIVREAGGLVSFPGFGPGSLAAPLDLAPHSPVVAARSAQTLARLEGVVA
jgi:myo-inositol-1(or 4)-monophosphatase